MPRLSGEAKGKGKAKGAGPAGRGRVRVKRARPRLQARASSVRAARDAFTFTYGPKRRVRPGTRALLEIRKQQKSTDLLIRKLPFQRLVRYLCDKRHDSMRWQQAALEALQEAAEAYLIEVLQQANLCALHGRRVTVQVRDIRLTRRIRGVLDIH